MKSKRMPTLLSQVALCTKKVLFCVFEDTKTNNYPKIGPSKNNKEQVKDVSPESVINEPETSNIEKGSDTHYINSDLQEQLKRKKLKEDFDSDLRALNNLAFIVLFTIILTFNMSIWISISI
jgi:hypothetical protein